MKVTSSALLALSISGLAGMAHADEFIATELNPVHLQGGAVICISLNLCQFIREPRLSNQSLPD